MYVASLGFPRFVMFTVSLTGLLYWRNVSAFGSTDVEQAVQQNKQTPETLKNQQKSMKLNNKNKY
ncbi:hypothetical protein V7S43_005739 [Phytophthora oleae]|uniref:RxLR effector protein n=1 Tax=Phytophthora oleae TaxID=2107226 RepID=A0ABD3FR65_9STRA